MPNLGSKPQFAGLHPIRPMWQLGHKLAIIGSKAAQMNSKRLATYGTLAPGASTITN